MVLCGAAGVYTLQSLIHARVLHGAEATSRVSSSLVVERNLTATNLHAGLSPAERADMWYAARHDGLTGLGNRLLLTEAATEALAEVSAAQPVALLLLDLDGFKDVNDTLGHDTGDQLLVAVTERLKAQTPSAAALVRLGVAARQTRRMDGREWLETLFVPALGRESLAYGNDADLLRVQLLALRDCAVLSAAQYGDAVERLAEAVRVAQEKAVFDVRPPDGTRRVRTRGGALHRVFAVGEPVAEVDAMPFLLTSVEVWSHRVDVFLAGVPNAESGRYIARHEDEFSAWARRRREGRSGDGALSPPLARGDRLFEVDVRLRDDVGTEYESTGGSSGGGRTAWRLHHHYRPGVPERARELIVEARDRYGDVAGEVTVALR